MEKNKWLIVFLIYVDFRKDGPGILFNEESARAIDNIFHDLYTCKINEGTKVFVVFNSIKNVKTVDDGTITQKEDFTCIYEFSSGPEDNIMSEFFKVDNMTAAGGDVQADKQLAAVFKSIYSREENKAEHIALYTWDHGSAFGIFKEPFDKKSTSLSFANPSLDPLIPLHKLNRFKYEFLFRFLDDDKSRGSLLVKSEQNEAYGWKSKTPLFQIHNLKYSLKVEDDLFGNDFVSEILSDKESGKLSSGWKMATDKEKQIEFRIKQSDFAFSNLDRSYRISEIPSMPEHHFRKENDNMVVNLEVEIPYHILTNKELAQAIKDGFYNQKVDVLLMMNCWMLNLDTAYTMVDAVEILVGAAGDISEPGYNYKEIISNTKQDTSPQDMANLCIGTLSLRSENEYRNRHLYRVEEWTILAVELKRVQAVAAIIDDISGKMSDYLDRLEPKAKVRVAFYLLNCRKHCYVLNSRGDCYIADITHWLNNVIYNRFTEFSYVSSNDIYIELFTATNQIEQLIALSTIKTFGTRNYFNFYNKGKVQSYPITGASVYFPESVSSQLDRSSNKYLIMDSEFISVQSNWLKMLRKIDEIVAAYP